jgi:hypothetical protein
MSDHDEDRPTPVPGLSEPLESDLEKPRPESFGKTQPIKPPTAEDVIEIFGHFRQDLLEQISKRDERILLAVHDIRSMITEHYQRETQRADEHAKWIKQLRSRTHRLSTEQQAINLRLAEIERRLEIPPPAAPSAGTPPEPEAA